MGPTLFRHLIDRLGKIFTTNLLCGIILFLMLMISMELAFQ
jgi:hypothetical protein